jgi:hypothetical protein
MLYRYLSSEEKEIRVLHLLPGHPDDEIEAELHIVSLDDSPSYEVCNYFVYLHSP